MPTRERAATGQSRALAHIVRAATALPALVALWFARAGTRRKLAELDDRILRDIGLTRQDVDREAAKPFWRA